MSQDTMDIVYNLETVKKENEAAKKEATEALKLAKAAEDHIKMLEAQVKKNLARGTKDMHPLVKEETAALPLSGRILEALGHGPLTSSALAKQLSEGLPKVQAETRTLRNAKKITNAGTEAAPRWNLKLDEKKATSKEIQTSVMRLITGTPMSFAELVIATGIRGGLVQGALVEIRRSGIEIHNFGTKARARYFVMPPNTLDARLAPKPLPGKAKTPSGGVPVVATESAPESE